MAPSSVASDESGNDVRTSPDELAIKSVVTLTDYGRTASSLTSMPSKLMASVPSTSRS